MGGKYWGFYVEGVSAKQNQEVLKTKENRAFDYIFSYLS